MINNMEIVGIEHKDWIPNGRNNLGLNKYLKRWIVYARATEKEKFNKGVYQKRDDILQEHWIKNVFVGKLSEVKEFIKDKQGGQRFLPRLKTGVSSLYFL